MTDERRQTLMQYRSKAARCLVRIIFANLKRRGVEGEAVHIILKPGTETHWIQAVSCTLSLPCMSHHPFLLYLILLFLQFPPIWIVATTLFSSKGDRRVDWQLQLSGELVQRQFWKWAHCECWIPSEHWDFTLC